MNEISMTEAPQDTSAKQRILLVEDDQFLSVLLKNRLAKENYDVTLAQDGNSALDFLRKNQYDVVLLDLILPGKSGFEVMEEIREEPKWLVESSPIIVISNLGQESDIARSKELGAADYFVKARTSIDDLMKKVAKVIHSQPPRT